MNGDQREARPAYIGLGSNLDDPPAQIRRAFELLETIPGTQVTSRSSLYVSAPFGSVEQPDFINAVAELSTYLDAPALLLQLQKIEQSQGRIRGRRWGPRVLDLDLLVYGDEEIDSPQLSVPHPGIAKRNFVLLPLREIAPELEIPRLGRIFDIAINESEPQISRIS